MKFYIFHVYLNILQIFEIDSHPIERGIVQVMDTQSYHGVSSYISGVSSYISGVSSLIYGVSSYISGVSSLIYGVSSYISQFSSFIYGYHLSYRGIYKR